MKTFRFFAGTHASAGQDSLCLCEADFKEAAFTELYTMREISDPTYLALSPDRILYTFGKTAAGVSVYAIREQAVISSLPCASGGPCHISVDERGEFLLVAGYGSGTVSLYDLNTDGSIRSLCDSRQYRGVGFDSEDRQKGPHAHFSVFHPERDEVLVCDLRLPDGSGPRHLAFSDRHPGVLFVLTEMANTIFTYRYNSESDKYVLVQQISAVCDGTSGVCPSDPALMLPSAADNGSIGCAIRFTKDGKYLFVSSRLGYQSISVFRCEPDGKLCFADRCLCGGITPRDFNIFENDDPEDPDIRLLVANQDSDLITALRFDRRAEKLSLLDMKMQAVNPTCILPI